MPRRRSLGVSFLLGTLVFLTGLVGSLRADEPGPYNVLPSGLDTLEWGEAVNGLRLMARTEKSEYVSGEPIAFAVGLQAVLPLGRGFPAGPLARIFDVVVTDARGRVRPLRNEGHDQPWGSDNAISAHGLSLFPGNIQVVDTPALNRLFDMSDPGTYTVVVHPRKYRTARVGPVPREPQSPPITIHIVERPEPAGV